MATIKQKLVIQKIIENHGNISKSMREVGYTKATAKNPSNLTKSKGMRELIENFVSDQSLISIHKNLINNSDNNTKIKVLNMFYKVKGLYPIDDKPKIKPKTKLEKMIERYEMYKDDSIKSKNLY